jgi:hypothetical protein
VVQNHIVLVEMEEKMSGDLMSFGLIFGLIFVIAVISFLTLGEDKKKLEIWFKWRVVCHLSLRPAK